MKEPLRYRQVHLDFHTSELIGGIGEEFTKEQFQEMLKIGHVDSITVFSKCHHGYAYHPTNVHEIHPGLTFDLLKAQLGACREIGVAAPVYISAGLDEKEAVRHPEWLTRFKDETTTWVSDFMGEPGYHMLCFGTGYLELLLNQIKEVMEQYHPEGIFLDISSVHPCYCSSCRNTILERGKDIRDEEAVMEQAELVYKHYGEAVRKVVEFYDVNCRIFHNAGHMTRGRRDLARHNTHLELESLPTGGWGYDHFPLSASYVCNLGMEYLGMTGKFHTTWGEFGGFKHPNALRYEAALSIAFGAKCSIGDQLHPSGRMEKDTYELIGKAYREVEAKEKWCKAAVSRADIGILSAEAFNSQVSSRDVERYSDMGANRIMLEGKYLYHFLDGFSDFSKYKLLILPDEIRLTHELKSRLEEYLTQGGKILATGESGLCADKEEFALDFGAVFAGKNHCRPNYIQPSFPLTTGNSPHVIYEQSYNLKMQSGTKLAENKPSYFNRDLLHFSSHQHTPYSPESGGAAISATEQTAYIGWRMFSEYAKVGSLHVKEALLYIIDYLIGAEKSVKTKLPDRGIVTMTEQPLKKRNIIHLLFAHTSMRGAFELQGKVHKIEVIEDLIPLYDVPLAVKIEEPVKRVYLVPTEEELSYTIEQGYLHCRVPVVEGHQMVVIEK